MQEISIIVAVGKNREIGKENNLLWHLSDDLKRFKKITTGHTIVMGRKTFESLPKGALPNRRNIVLTNQNLKIDNVEIIHTKESLWSIITPNEKIFIIGGASIYKAFFNDADTIHLTKVNASFDADVYFPDFDETQWEKIAEEHFSANEKNEFDYSYLQLKRK